MSLPSRIIRGPSPRHAFCGRTRAAAGCVARVAALTGLVLLSSCARNRVRTERIPVSAVACAECVPIIEGVLGSFNRKGGDTPVVIAVKADAARAEIALTFNDSKAHVMNFVGALNDAGFDAAGRPGAPEAKLRLPECCR